MDPHKRVPWALMSKRSNCTMALIRRVVNGLHLLPPVHMLACTGHASTTGRARVLCVLPRV